MRRAIAVILSFLILGSNLSLAVTTHFCMGHIAKVGITHSLETFGCGMTMETVDCDETQGVHLKRSNCCENDSQFLSIDDEYNTSSVLDYVNLAQSPLAVEPSIQPITQQDYSEHFAHAPPLHKYPLHIVFEQFLL